MKTTKRQSNNRDIEKHYPPAEFIAKLRRLADALEAGKPFTVEVAGERLRIPADAHFNIEHEREGGQEELEFQLKWRRRTQPTRRARTASGG
jgi:amphi-Trp domain-containing protein